MKTQVCAVGKAAPVITCCWLALCSWCSGAALVVTTLSDSGPGSFRNALSSANEGDIITFAVSGAITNVAGEFVVDRSVGILGPGPEQLALSGGNSRRVLRVASGAVVSISGLTIRDGNAPNGLAGTDPFTSGGPGEDGGGVLSSGTLALTNCVITRCRSGKGGAGFSDTWPSPPGGNGASNGGPGGNGAGVYSQGTLTLAGCTVSCNTNGAGGAGGTIRWTTGQGGAGGSGGSGGGIYDAGSVTLIACTFAFNGAGAGGAGGSGGYGDDIIYDGGAGGYGGKAGSGGGLYSSSSPILISCTLAGNVAGSGGAGGKGGFGYASFTSAGSGGTGGDGGAGGDGGGLCSLGSVQFLACTIAGNGAGKGGNGGAGGSGAVGSRGPGGNGGIGGNGGSAGGGGGADVLGGTGPGTLQNTLAAQNSAGASGLAGAAGQRGPGTPYGFSGSPGVNGPASSGADLLGSFASNGHNLVSLDDAGVGITDGLLGDIVGTTTPIDASLGPLAAYGGPTLTCALLSGSPALEAGDDSLLEAPMFLAADQRGVARQSGAHVDIGAFELVRPSLPVRLSAHPNAGIEITLTNVPSATLMLLASTNPAAPMATWSLLGPMPEPVPGQFRFVDSATTTSPRSFYRVRCP